MRSVTSNPEWYLDLVYDNWFPGWEKYWEDLCTSNSSVSRATEVLSAVQGKKVTAIWFANHYLWVKWLSRWLYVEYKQREIPYRTCEIRSCPHHTTAVISIQEQGSHREHRDPEMSHSGFCWATGTCMHCSR